MYIDYMQVCMKKFLLKTENRRQDVISLNQPRGMSAKMAANEIRTHACTNQRRTLASRLRQSFNAFRFGSASSFQLHDIKALLKTECLSSYSGCIKLSIWFRFRYRFICQGTSIRR